MSRCSSSGRNGDSDRHSSREAFQGRLSIYLRKDRTTLVCLSCKRPCSSPQQPCSVRHRRSTDHKLHLLFWEGQWSAVHPNFLVAQQCWSESLWSKLPRECLLPHHSDRSAMSGKSSSFFVFFFHWYDALHFELVLHEGVKGSGSSSSAAAKSEWKSSSLELSPSSSLEHGFSGRLKSRSTASSCVSLRPEKCMVQTRLPDEPCRSGDRLSRQSPYLARAHAFFLLRQQLQSI